MLVRKQKDKGKGEHLEAEAVSEQNRSSVGVPNAVQSYRSSSVIGGMDLIRKELDAVFPS